MWETGTATVTGITFNYQMKRYDTGSEWGIYGGRISKLTVYLHGAAMVRYDRGWGKLPETPEADAATEEIIRRFNW